MVAIFRESPLRSEASTEDVRVQEKVQAGEGEAGETEEGPVTLQEGRGTQRVSSGDQMQETKETQQSLGRRPAHGPTQGTFGRVLNPVILSTSFSCKIR